MTSSTYSWFVKILDQRMEGLGKEASFHLLDLSLLLRVVYIIYKSFEVVTYKTFRGAIF